MAPVISTVEGKNKRLSGQITNSCEELFSWEWSGKASLRR